MRLIYERVLDNQMSNHYVDNKTFFKVLKQYLEDVKLAEEQERPEPRVPDYIGICIMEIARKLSNKSNFVNYTYKEEMISDGIENAIMVVKNFNPEKSNNPFAYFTQIIYYAFLRRIQKEKKHSYIKHKSLESFYFENLLSYGQAEVTIDDEKARDLVEKFEKKPETKPKPVKKIGIERFIEDEEQ